MKQTQIEQIEKEIKNARDILHKLKRHTNANTGIWSFEGGKITAYEKVLEMIKNE